MVDSQSRPFSLFKDEKTTQTIYVTDSIEDVTTSTDWFDLGKTQFGSFGKLLNALPIPALVVDEAFAIVFANQACSKIRADCAEATGQSFCEFFPDPADASSVQQLINDVFAERKAHVSQATLGDGNHKVWGRMHLQPIKLKDTRAVLVQIEDLTREREHIIRTETLKEELREARDELEERVKQRTAELLEVNEQLRREIRRREKVEAELRQSEERYRAVVEDQTELICRFLPDGTLTFVNEANCRYFGKRREDLLGRSFLELLPEEGRDAVGSHLKALSPDDPVSTYEHRVVAPDGTYRWQHLTDRAIFDDKGILVEYQSVGRDITELKRAYEELSLSKERLRYVLSSSPVVIYTCRPDGDLGTTFVSENVRSLIGCEPWEYVNNSSFWSDRIHPEDVQRVYTGLAPLFDQGHHVQEYRFLHGDGTYHWMRDELRLVRDAEGHPFEIVGSWIDITDRKIAEEQLKKSVGEKEVLLREIHHRVKNNLQIMSSLLDLQAAYMESERDVEILKDTESRIWSMALVHEALYQSEDQAYINVKEYIENLVEELVHSYGQKASRVRVAVRVEDIFFGIDTAVPCGLIINELISNSLKHAFPDGRNGEIVVVIRSIEDDAFELGVMDDGVGMDVDVNSPHTQSFGLRLVRTLVTQLHGDMTLDGAAGTHTRITFKEVKGRRRKP